MLRRQVSTQREKIEPFFQQLTEMDPTFMAILAVCGFNDWLLAELEKWKCQEIVLIHPEKPSKKKTDRRDAKILGHLLWLNRQRLAAGGSTTTADVWAASAAPSALPGAKSVRLAWDSPANPPDAPTPSLGGSHTGHTRSPALRFVSSAVAHRSEHADNVAACSAIGPALDTPGVRSRSRVRERLGHARLLDAASPGPDVSRGGFP